MAIVYKVRLRASGEVYALKLLRIPNARIRARLEQEGRLRQDLEHENVVPVVDQLEHEGMPGLVMPYVPGPSLAALLSRRPLTLEQTDLLAFGLFEGVLAAHAAGITHRDLKPGNVLLEVTPNALVPRVTDFGLSKLYGDGRSGISTRAGTAMGTPSYMAPEQIADAKTADQRADVWSTGAILYEMITGKMAFGGKDTYDIFQRIEEGRFKPIRRFVPSVPERMARAVNSALVTNPAKRAASIDELRDIWFGRKRSVGEPAPEAGSIEDHRPKPMQLMALSAVVHRTMGDSWSEAPELELDPDTDVSAVPPLPKPVRRKGPDVQTLNLEDDMVQGIEPMPLPDSATFPEYEGDSTVIHRIRREYGIVAAIGTLLLTAFGIMALGMVSLWVALMFVDTDPAGPSLDEAIEAPP